jgi:16S rRNA (adenine1518-N6/adenine1519-N6)-dimethyltransferase
MTKSAHSHRPRKRFGQHFLTDVGIADKIVAAADVGAEDAVLEIGPGRGVLTGRLIGLARSLIAVEIDRDLVPRLREQYGDVQDFRLVEDDILDVDLHTLLPPWTDRLRVVANIPYNITNPIVARLIEHRAIIRDAVLMVQKEVADRLVSPPGSKAYGLTTINLALHADTERLFTVRPGSFTPPPAVQSAVIRINFLDAPRHFLPDERLFRDLTGVAFRQRRKMVRNTLLPALTARGIDAETAVGMMTACGIEPTVRPETVSPAQFADLAARVFAFSHAASSEGTS